ncbi:MAG: nucleotidyltransferase domain-containing protein [Rhizobiaceae bacterium]
MDRNEIIAKLQAHRQRLLAKGVVTLSLFGSTARGENDAQSDIDLAVRLDDRFSAGGFDYFAKLEALREELAGLLGQPVDLIEEPVRAERIQAAIDQDRLIAFQ